MAALRRMQPRDRGTIVQVGSALAYRGIPLQSAYCGAKHAIQGFHESLRCELLHDGSDVRDDHGADARGQHPAVQLGALPAAAPGPAGAADLPAGGRRPRRSLYAADHPQRREYWVGGSTGGTLLANAVAPGLLDRYLARTGFRPSRPAGAAATRTSPPTSGSRPTRTATSARTAASTPRLDGAQPAAVGLPAPRHRLLRLPGAAAAGAVGCAAGHCWKGQGGEAWKPSGPLRPCQSGLSRLISRLALGHQPDRRPSWWCACWAPAPAAGDGAEPSGRRPGRCTGRAARWTSACGQHGAAGGSGSRRRRGGAAGRPSPGCSRLRNSRRAGARSGPRRPAAGRGSGPMQAAVRLAPFSCGGPGQTARLRSQLPRRPARRRPWPRSGTSGSAAGRCSSTAAIASRRWDMTCVHQLRALRGEDQPGQPAVLGSSPRSISPAWTSRSHVRVALEGWTPSSTATAPRILRAAVRDEHQHPQLRGRHHVFYFCHRLGGDPEQDVGRPDHSVHLDCRPTRSAHRRSVLHLLNSSHHEYPSICCANEIFASRQNQFDDKERHEDTS